MVCPAMWWPTEACPDLIDLSASGDDGKRVEVLLEGGGLVLTSSLLVNLSSPLLLSPLFVRSL